MSFPSAFPIKPNLKSHAPSPKSRNKRKGIAEMEEYFSFQATNNFSSKHGSITTKKRLTHDQLHLLETSFITNPKLEGERKQELASKLGLPPKQVAVWYQNKRARCKTEAIELDHKAIQLQLQNVLAHNKQLQSEVRRLTHKLNQAHHLLFPASNPSAASASASAPSFNVLASSSLNSPASVNAIWENADSIWKNAEVLPIMEELYACLLE